MATKRPDSNAVQVRLADEEAAALDKWVESLQTARIGSSGVSRTSIVRDLLVTALRRREEIAETVEWAKQILPWLRKMATARRFKVEEREVVLMAHEVSNPFGCIGEIETSRLDCAVDAARLLDSTKPRTMPSGEVIEWWTILDLPETVRLLTVFIQEAEAAYGGFPDPEPDPMLGD